MTKSPSDAEKVAEGRRLFLQKRLNLANKAKGSAPAVQTTPAADNHVVLEFGTPTPTKQASVASAVGDLLQPLRSLAGNGAGPNSGAAPDAELGDAYGFPAIAGGRSAVQYVPPPAHPAAHPAASVPTWTPPVLPEAVAAPAPVSHGVAEASQPFVPLTMLHGSIIEPEPFVDHVAPKLSSSFLPPIEQGDALASPVAAPDATPAWASSASMEQARFQPTAAASPELWSSISIDGGHARPASVDAPVDGDALSMSPTPLDADDFLATLPEPSSPPALDAFEESEHEPSVHETSLAAPVPLFFAPSDPEEQNAAISASFLASPAASHQASIAAADSASPNKSLLLSSAYAADAAEADDITFEELDSAPALPAAPEMTQQPSPARTFPGVAEGASLTASTASLVPTPEADEPRGRFEDAELVEALGGVSPARLPAAAASAATPSKTASPAASFAPSTSSAAPLAASSVSAPTYEAPKQASFVQSAASSIKSTGAAASPAASHVFASPAQPSFSQTSNFASPFAHSAGSVAQSATTSYAPSPARDEDASLTEEIQDALNRSQVSFARMSSLSQSLRAMQPSFEASFHGAGHDESVLGSLPDSLSSSVASFTPAAAPAQPRAAEAQPARVNAGMTSHLPLLAHVIEQFEAEIAVTREVGATLQHVVGRMHTLMEDKRSLNGKLRAMKEQVNKMDNALSQRQGENEILERRLREARTQIDVWERRSIDAAKNGDELGAKLRIFERENELLKTRIDQVSTEAEILKQAQKEKEMQEMSAEEQLDDLRQQLEKCQAALDQEHAEHTMEKERLATRLAESASFVETQAAITDEWKSRAEAAERECLAFRSKPQEFAEQIALLEEQLKVLRGEKTELADQLHRYKVASRMEVSPERKQLGVSAHRLAERPLADSLRSSVAESEVSLSDLSGSFQHTEEDGTASDKHRLPRSAKIIQRLSEQVAEARQDLRRVSGELVASQETVSKLLEEQKELRSSRVQMQSEEVARLTAELDEQQVSFRRLGQEKVALEERIRDYESEVNSLRTSRAQLSSQLRSAKESADHWRLEIDSQRAAYDALRVMHENATEQHIQLRGEFRKALEERDQLQAEIADLRADGKPEEGSAMRSSGRTKTVVPLGEIRTVYVKDEKAIAEAQEALAAAREAEAEAESKVKSLAMAIDIMGKDLSSLRTELNLSKQELERVKSDHTLTQMTLESTSAELSLVRQSLADSTATNADLVSDNQRLRTELEEHRLALPLSGIAQLESMLSNLRQENRTNQKERQIAMQLVEEQKALDESVLRTERDMLVDQVARLSSVNSDLRRSQREFATQVERSMPDPSLLRSQFDTLERTAAVVAAERDLLKSKLAESQQEVNSLRSSLQPRVGDVDEELPEDAGDAGFDLDRYVEPISDDGELHDLDDANDSRDRATSFVVHQDVASPSLLAVQRIRAAQAMESIVETDFESLDDIEVGEDSLHIAPAAAARGTGAAPAAPPTRDALTRAILEDAADRHENVDSLHAWMEDVPPTPVREDALAAFAKARSAPATIEEEEEEDGGEFEFSDIEIAENHLQQASDDDDGFADIEDLAVDVAAESSRLHGSGMSIGGVGSSAPISAPVSAPVTAPARATANRAGTITLEDWQRQQTATSMAALAASVPVVQRLSSKPQAAKPQAPAAAAAPGLQRWMETQADADDGFDWDDDSEEQQPQARLPARASALPAADDDDDMDADFEGLDDRGPLAMRPPPSHLEQLQRDHVVLQMSHMPRAAGGANVERTSPSSLNSDGEPRGDGLSISELGVSAATFVSRDAPLSPVRRPRELTSSAPDPPTPTTRHSSASSSTTSANSSRLGVFGGVMASASSARVMMPSQLLSFTSGRSTVSARGENGITAHPRLLASAQAAHGSSRGIIDIADGSLQGSNYLLTPRADMGLILTNQAEVAETQLNDGLNTYLYDLVQTSLTRSQERPLPPPTFPQQSQPASPTPAGTRTDALVESPLHTSDEGRRSARRLFD